MYGAWLCATLLGAASTFAVAPAQTKKKAAPPTASASGPKSQLKNLKGQIQTLQARLRAAKAKQDALRLQLQTTETTIAQVGRTVHRFDRRLAAEQAALRKLDEEQRDRKRRLAIQRAELARQVRAYYALGGVEELKIMLGTQDPAALSRSLHYARYLHRARSALIADITHQVAALEENKRVTAQRTERYSALKREAAQHQMSLEQARAQRGQVLARIGLDIQTKEQRLTQLIEDQKRLQTLIERLKARPRPTPRPPVGRGTPPLRPTLPPDRHSAFGKLAGALPWPVAGPVVARYGASRKLGTSRWQGILIGAPEGKEVRAIYTGEVVFADWMRGYGHLLIIDHDDGYMSLYGYNQTLNKSVGDKVVAGDVIALVGNSGGQEQSGLYFELRRQGQPINPTGWLAK